jgi:enediyne biosynthesis protein E4
VNMGEAPSLLKNFADAGNSLTIRAVTAGRDAIGARVIVTAAGHKQIDEVRSGGSYISQNDFRLHFGLSRAATAEVSIRWPDGKDENIGSLAAGQIVTVEENKGVVRKQTYSSPKN